MPWIQANHEIVSRSAVKARSVAQKGGQIWRMGVRTDLISRSHVLQDWSSVYIQIPQNVQ